ncbi:MAG: acyl-ACP--UDP-N-acetylglucosamine O-acyltransferase [Ignavibacteria bacterium]|jgi:UDP-N-acetylglucosamine acyltransferase
MNHISEYAIVSPKAKIGDNVTIKQFSIIEDDVVIKDNVHIATNAIICSGTRIDKNCKVYHSVVLGSEPHDMKFGGEYTTLEIGHDTIIREFTTISRGTKEKKITIVGNHSFIMAYVHIPHDTVIGDNVILANAVNMGGHCIIEDWAIVGGLVGIHQFVKIGAHSFIGFSSRVNQDVPPYVLAAGNPIRYEGLNVIGLRRRGFTSEKINQIKQVYNLIYNSKYNTSDALKIIKDTLEQTGEVKQIVDFIETSKRGIIGV